MPKRNIVHVELSSRNFDESGRFYQALFDWKITPIPEAGYTVWESGEGSRGGFTAPDDDLRIGEVMIYVASDDIEADLKKAKSLGAKIVQEKKEFAGRGWYGVFMDPTGNRIGLATFKSRE